MKLNLHALKYKNFTRKNGVVNPVLFDALCANRMWLFVCCLDGIYTSRVSFMKEALMVVRALYLFFIYILGIQVLSQSSDLFGWYN